MKKEQIILTRPFFCPDCLREKRPQKGQRYVTIGSTRKELMIHRVEENGSFGFVPTLCILEKVEDKKAHLSLICGMDECGIRISKEQNEKGKYPISFDYERKVIIPLKEWNILVLCGSDLGYNLGK